MKEPNKIHFHFLVVGTYIVSRFLLTLLNIVFSRIKLLAHFAFNLC